ncbi:MAG: polymer-forming cytoskeletal protein [Chloroflexota bacterium]
MRSAEAFDGRQAESLIITQDEVLTEDLYFNGGSLIVDGVIQGDLFFAGGELEINGRVEGDVYAGGNQININGIIQDDLLAGGSSLVISDGAIVFGDALVGGFGVELEDGAKITGDYVIGAQNILISGDIEGNLSGGGAGIEISGSIGGDVDLEFGEEGGLPFDLSRLNPNLPEDTLRVPEGIVITDNALIEGDFHYNSVRTFDIPQELIGGEISFTQNPIFTPPTAAERFASGLWQGVQRWAVVLVFGILALLFAPSLVNRPVHLFTTDVRRGVLAGTISYFLWIPALILLLVLSVLLGSFFGLINLNTIATLIIAVGLAFVIIDVVLIVLVLGFAANIWAGQLIGNALFSTSSDSKQTILPLAVGTLIVVLLGRMPFIGGLVRLAVGVIGLGIIWLWWRYSRN